jgi:uncharacterized damage-inducible protein DinB
MIDYFKQVVLGQFEAALCMIHQCVQACREEHWEGKIANDTLRQVAYHTLFCAELYLSQGEDAFELREIHQRGGDESQPTPSIGLSREETLSYVAFCRQKVTEALARETAESLQGPSGFSWVPTSRGELYLYNLRHVQHHAGQMSAYLRRVDPALKDPKALPWVKTGWR